MIAEGDWVRVVKQCCEGNVPVGVYFRVALVSEKPDEVLTCHCCGNKITDHLVRLVGGVYKDPQSGTPSKFLRKVPPLEALGLLDADVIGEEIC